jgi:neutral trehalase
LLLLPGFVFHHAWGWSKAARTHYSRRANYIAALIDHHGHIPNGNRTYYLSHSQPPFFAQMIPVVALKDGEPTNVKYLAELQQEYTYWMDGSANLKPGTAYRHSVVAIGRGGGEWCASPARVTQSRRGRRG